MELLYKNEYKELLKVVIQGEIIKSDKGEKIILIEFSLDLGFKSEIVPLILEAREK